MPSQTHFYSPAPQDNFLNDLINGNFDFWQRSTSVTVANGVSTYQADRWYVKNSLGTNGVITFSRVTGVNNGALYGASVKITTAPTLAQANGCELYQTMENLQSLKYYGQNASFGIQVKALGNVTSVGLQFFYKTTEAKVDTAIGSEVTVTVNTSSFVRGVINGQAIGTSQTTSGVIGVRVRILGVSSGNTYDLNNGFIVEQGIVTNTTTVQPFTRAGRTIADEIAACQRFYEKSMPLDTASAATDDGACYFHNVKSGGSAGHFRFATRKRTAPTIAYYDSNDGSSGNFFDVTATTHRGVTAQTTGTTSCSFLTTATNAYAANAGDTMSGHFTADAEI